jgi:hypothetical protein
VGKKTSSPPDAKGAAQVEGEYSRETARDTTYADRPDQYNPFGSIQWGTEQVIDPATGEPVTKWTQQQSLSDDSQSIYNPMMNFLQNKAELSSGMMGRVQDEMGAAPDWSQFGDVVGLDYDPTQIRAAAEDAAYQKEANRLDPRFNKEAEALDVRLRNQGLRPGDQSYDAQMSSFTTGKNDAYEQARLGATATGRQEAEMLYGQQMQSSQYSNALRDKQIQEYLDKRGFSLGEANALDPTSQLAELTGMFSGGSASQ